MNEIKSLAAAKKRLMGWGFPVTDLGSGVINLQKGGRAYRLTYADILSLARAHPQTIQSASGNRLHLAIRIGKEYVTSCGEVWTDEQVMKRPKDNAVPCDVCQHSTESGSWQAEGKPDAAQRIEAAGNKLAGVLAKVSSAVFARSSAPASDAEPAVGGSPWHAVEDQYGNWMEEVTFPDGQTGVYRDDGHRQWLEVVHDGEPSNELHEPFMDRAFALDYVEAGTAYYRETISPSVKDEIRKRTENDIRKRTENDRMTKAIERMFHTLQNLGAVGSFELQQDWEDDPEAANVSDQDLWDRLVTVANYNYRMLQPSTWTGEAPGPLDTPAFMDRFAKVVVAMDRRNFQTKPLSRADRRNLVWMLRKWGAALPGEETLGHTTWKV